MYWTGDGGVLLAFDAAATVLGAVWCSLIVIASCLLVWILLPS